MTDREPGQPASPVAVAKQGDGDLLMGVPQPHDEPLDEPLEQVEMQFVSYRYDGPLPAPQAMSGYQRVNPEFPERIMRMAEREMEHRHARELRELGIFDGSCCSRSRNVIRLRAMNVIADLRARLGLTQLQMGAELGVSQHAVSQYERGDRSPASQVMRKIARLAERNGLTYTLADLFPDQPPAQPQPEGARDVA